VAVAVVAFVSGVTTAASTAAAPTATAQLHAKAGPVTMHAVLSLQLAPPAGAKTVGALSACVIQHSSPRSGIADKIVCTSATGHKVAARLAPTSAALSYQLASSSPQASLQSATLQIRRGTTVLFTLSGSSGTLTIPLAQTAALLNGHDALYVRAGTHAYHGKIVQ
jgi:hypothetical protein